MKLLRNIILIALLFLDIIVPSSKTFAQVGKAEHDYLKAKTGEWEVVMTLRPSADATAQIIKGLTADRVMVGDYCLQEMMEPSIGQRVPDFKRLCEFAYNLNEQRWDYMSIDTRLTAGIMYFTYQGSTKNTITSFLISFPNPGMGSAQKGRGQALYARNVVVKIDNDHDMVKQFWRLTDKKEWLAVQYEYTRSH